MAITSWRIFGQNTVAAYLDRLKAFDGDVIVGPHEFAVVVRDGAIQEVFSEGRRDVRRSGNPLRSIVGRAPAIQVLVADTSPFHLEILLEGPGDPSDLGAGRPLVITADGQPVTAHVNLTLSVVSDSADFLLRFMRGRDAIGTTEVAEAIRGELLAKVLALQLSQRTATELRGNDDLLRSLYDSLRVELASTLDNFGFRLDNFYVHWGLTHTEGESIKDQLHESRLRDEERRRELDAASAPAVQPVAPDTQPVGVPPTPPPPPPAATPQAPPTISPSPASGSLAAQDPSAFVDRGLAHLEQGNFEWALWDLDEALRLDPRNALAYSHRSLAYYVLGWGEQAIQGYDQAIRLDNQNAQTYIRRGDAHRAFGRHEQAMRDYDEAVRLDPQHTSPYNNRGVAYSDLGQHERAIQDYDEALRLDPQNTMAYSNRGSSYHYLGKSEQAIQDYDKAIGLYPQNASAYLGRGDAYHALGRHERAMQDYDEAVRLNPQHTTPYNNRGVAYGDLGMHKRAIQDYDEAIRLDPYNGQAYYNRGVAYSNLWWKFKEATSDFQRAKELGVG